MSGCFLMWLRSGSSPTPRSHVTTAITHSFVVLLRESVAPHIQSGSEWMRLGWRIPPHSHFHNDVEASLRIKNFLDGRGEVGIL